MVRCPSCNADFQHTEVISMQTASSYYFPRSRNSQSGVCGWNAQAVIRLPYFKQINAFAEQRRTRIAVAADA
jgi:hypothetical protein